MQLWELSSIVNAAEKRLRVFDCLTLLLWLLVLFWSRKSIENSSEIETTILQFSYVVSKEKCPETLHGLMGVCVSVICKIFIWEIIMVENWEETLLISWAYCFRLNSISTFILGKTICI